MPCQLLAITGAKAPQPTFVNNGGEGHRLDYLFAPRGCEVHPGSAYTLHEFGKVNTGDDHVPVVVSIRVCRRRGPPVVSRRRCNFNRAKICDPAVGREIGSASLACHFVTRLSIQPRTGTA